MNFEREFVALRAEILAEPHKPGNGDDGPDENLYDHTARRQEARGTPWVGGEIEIDNGFGIAGEQSMVESTMMLWRPLSAA